MANRYYSLRRLESERMLFQRREGFTLIELMLGVVTTAIVLAAILGAYMGQVILNEHSRNALFAMQDADRVMEGMRAENNKCATPSAVADSDGTGPNPSFAGGWDAWLAAPMGAGGGGGKSIPLDPADPVNSERIVVTCRDNATKAYCGTGQVSTEWNTLGGPSAYPTLEITVAVCWRHRGRTIGECSPAGALAASDTDADGIIESPVMLATTLSCPPSP